MRKTTSRPPVWDRVNFDDGIQLAVRDRSYNEHRRRLRNVKSSLEVHTPRHFPKLQGNTAGSFTPAECAHISVTNKRLLRRLTTIACKRSKFSKMKAPKRGRKSLNQSVKNRENARIDRENAFLVRRIMGCKSSIDHKKIDQDWNRHRNIVYNHNAARRKRKQFRPNRLSPLSTDASSMASDASTMSTSFCPSPATLQRFIESQTLQHQSPKSLAPITETSEHGRLRVPAAPAHPQPVLKRRSPRAKAKVNTNHIFSPMVRSMLREEIKDTEQEDVFEEVLSDWERDEEWIEHEKVTKKKKSKGRRTVTIGLPAI